MTDALDVGILPRRRLADLSLSMRYETLYGEKPQSDYNLRGTRTIVKKCEWEYTERDEAHRYV